MELNKKKFLRIIIVACISLSLMFAGQWYYSKNIMEKSLIKSLSLKPYVNNVEIKKEQGKALIIVEFKDVDNLKKVYTEIHSLARHKLKGNPFELKILNKPDILLDELYENDIQFIVYEAINTGKFTQMKAELESSDLKDQHVSIKVFLDSENLYLQLEHNKSGFYEVIRRVN